MHLCDETWVGFVNLKEDNNVSVVRLCDASLLYVLKKTCQCWYEHVEDLW